VRLNTLPTKWLAFLAGLSVMMIWSGWIVISRDSMSTNLTAGDVTLIRFVTAALFTLPLSLAYSWRDIPIKRALVVALGCGFPYTLFTFYGLSSNSAANAGVIVNGFLPVISAILAVIFLNNKLGKPAWLAIALIVCANFLVLVPELTGSQISYQFIVSILLLLTASGILATYMTAVKYWQVSLKEVLIWVPSINAILFIPVWFFLPHQLFSATVENILVQAGYQGLIVSVFALFLFTYAIKHLGTVISSLFMAMVPAITALLGLWILGESPSAFAWWGIVVCTMGLLLFIAINSKSNTKKHHKAHLVNKQP
jgi:drug/metabolite transporter (DMT)-like permease